MNQSNSEGKHQAVDFKANISYTEMFLIDEKLFEIFGLILKVQQATGSNLLNSPQTGIMGLARNQWTALPWRSAPHFVETET